MTTGFVRLQLSGAVVLLVGWLCLPEVRLASDLNGGRVLAHAEHA